jgi:hypothetical protein
MEDEKMAVAIQQLTGCACGDYFYPACTVDIATEIGQINKGLVSQNRKYLLIGPGRWGSADRETNHLFTSCQT